MRKLWLFFPVLLLSACIGTSRPARFYNLQAENIGAYSNAAVRADIGVREVKIPDYLDKPQIATLKSGGVEVDISELNRWSESLSTMIQRVVADDLGYNLPKVYEGRGPLEAASIGVDLQPGEMAMRCNIICIEGDNIKNHSAGHITTEEADVLVKYLQEHLGDDRVHFLSLIHISEPTRP